VWRLGRANRSARRSGERAERPIGTSFWRAPATALIERSAPRRPRRRVRPAARVFEGGVHIRRAEGDTRPWRRGPVTARRSGERPCHRRPSAAPGSRAARRRRT
jgi:hypothetical protein